MPARSLSFFIWCFLSVYFFFVPFIKLQICMDMCVCVHLSIYDGVEGLNMNQKKQKRIESFAINWREKQKYTQKKKNREDATLWPPPSIIFFRKNNNEPKISQILATQNINSQVFLFFLKIPIDMCVCSNFRARFNDYGTTFS